jgi:hypothetical protein
LRVDFGGSKMVMKKMCRELCIGDVGPKIRYSEKYRKGLKVSKRMAALKKNPSICSRVELPLRKDPEPQCLLTGNDILGSDEHRCSSFHRPFQRGWQELYGFMIYRQSDVGCTLGKEERTW